MKLALQQLLAQEPPGEGITVPHIGPIEGTLNLQTLILNIGGWVLWIALALAVIYLIYGGVIYITSAGNPEKATQGKNALIHSVIGIAIIVAAIMIIRLVFGFMESAQ